MSMRGAVLPQNWGLSPNPIPTPITCSAEAWCLLGELQKEGQAVLGTSQVVFFTCLLSPRLAFPS